MHTFKKQLFTTMAMVYHESRQQTQENKHCNEHMQMFRETLAMKILGLEHMSYVDYRHVAHWQHQ